MKKTLIVMLAALMGVSFNAMAAKKKVAQQPDPLVSSAPQQLDSLSYALGMSMGHNFKHSGINNVNTQDFTEGILAILNGATPRMTDQQAEATIKSHFEKLQAKEQAEKAKVAESNAATGKAFLAENGKRPEVTTTPSGLQYEVLTEGTGAQPTAQDKVKVHYTGKLINGTVFDSSVERGEPVEFGVTQVIPGWTEALQLMKTGAKYRLYIPSNLAYGANGAGGVIGPNETLIFDVELLDIPSQNK